MLTMKLLVINVSGWVFEISDVCLDRFPRTLLGDSEKRKMYFKPHERIYFFDRHRLAFEGIMMFYQTYGRVHCPDNVPEEVFRSELRFFDIECNLLDAAEEAQSYLQNVQICHTFPSIKQRVWVLFKHPTGSRLAKFISTISLVVTLVSIFLACFGTDEAKNPIWMDQETFPFEVPCFVWFTLEYALRLWSCPDKKEFLTNWIDCIDLFLLLVFYNSLAFMTIHPTSTSIFRIFRLAKAFRLFRLTRFSFGLRLLIYTLCKSRTDLQLLTAFFVFFIVTSGSMIYYAEDGNIMFNGGVLDGIWFSVISCTTVGYGDITPVSLTGKIMTSLTITLGAMLVRLPVLKLVQSFSDALEGTKSWVRTNDKNSHQKDSIAAPLH